MIWVAWRQQRLQIMISLALASIAAAVMVFVRIGAAGFLADGGFAGCWQRTDGCLGASLNGLSERYNQYVSLYPLVLLVLAPLLGIFAGAPMFARELEQGTHVFGLTQSVSRARWFATKALVGGVPVALAMTCLGLLNSWSMQPLRPVMTMRLLTPRFETEALALGAYTLLAVVVGLTLGLWTRNTVLSMAISLAIYVGVLVTLGNAARPHYVTPVSMSETVDKAIGFELMPDDGWRVASGYLDVNGKEVYFSPSSCLTPVQTAQESPTDERTEARAQIRDCLEEGGVDRLVASYLPDSRFWTLQFIESGIVLVLSGALLGLAGVALRRRLY